jgi:hypothetical protein
MNQRGFWNLGGVSDETLVVGLKELTRREGWTEARIVAHLAELDERRLHLKQAKSLFEYCQKDLGLSDNQAYYRIAAARLARRFPILFELIERREVHVTTLPSLAPYLTPENHRELLGEARGLSKRDVLELLARRFPRADVPSQIRKLPGSAGTFRAGPTGSLEPLSETSYRLQLNTSQALKEKLELARDLMSHANRSGDLAVVVERALDLLIERLKKERFGHTSRRRCGRTRPKAASKEGATDFAGAGSAAAGHAEAAAPPSEGRGPIVAEPAKAAAAEEATALLARESDADARFERSKSNGPRKRAHIANEVRRQVVARDGLRCSYVGEGGARCNAKGFLQLHHERAWAKGGADATDNLRLLCAQHNHLLAEQEYGRQVVARAKVPASGGADIASRS